MKALKSYRSNFTVNIVGAVLALLLVFSLIVSLVGYISFTTAYKNEYAETTYHMADTAALLVNSDEIDEYLKNGGDSESYWTTKRYLDSYCDKMNVSLIYVIKVDTSDYGRFTSIFNSVGKDTPYTEWELGYQRDATNEEYVRTYRALYEGEIPYGTIYRSTNLNGSPPHITTLVPVRNSADEVVSLLCIQRPMEALTSSRRPYLITIAFSTVLLMLLSGFVATAYLRHQFVKPIRKITDEAQRFAAENRAGEKLGDSISRIDDIAALASSIDTMEDEMLEYIDNLTEVTADKERIGTELALAASIQTNSIPSVFPAFPDREDFDIYASMTPAKEVGGDFYDFFMIDDDHLAMTIADVAGKGIPAALFMMVTNILVKERAHMGGTPADVLTFVNQRICEHNRDDMFVSVWLGFLEFSTGKLTFANAGHEAPALKRADGDFELFKSKHGLVIGAMEYSRYRNEEITLRPGDKLFLYTDGVPESTDADENLFGLEAMVAVLNQNKDKKPRAIIENLRQSVSDFIGEAPPFDDLTALCFELKEAACERLIVEAALESFEDVDAFLGRCLDKWGCSPKAKMKIALMAEEAFVNIAHYAYPDQTGSAEIILEKNNNDVILTLKDKGIPYDPLKKKDPDITLSAADRAIGGLGIFLIKKNADDVSYAHTDGYNVLKITKNIL